MAITKAVKGAIVPREELLGSFGKSPTEDTGVDLSNLINQGVVKQSNEGYEFLQDYDFGMTPRYSAQTGAGTDFDPMSYYKTQAQIPMKTEEQILEEERKKIQGQIDLINTNLEREMGRIGEKEISYLGQQRGVSARQGLGGSGMGYAQKSKITSAMADERRLADEEARAKISMAMSNADDRALQRFQSERTAKQQDMASYVAMLGKQKEEARADMSAISQASTRESLGSDFYSKLVEQSGYDKNTFDLVWDANYAKANQAKEIMKEKTADGKLTIMYQMPDGTVETKKYDWDYPEAPEIIGGLPYIRDDSGNLILSDNMATQMSIADMIKKYPDAKINYNDTTEQARAKLNNSAIYAKEVRQTGGSEKTTDSEKTNEIINYLKTNNLFGTDKKVSWETYLAMKQTWINNGGSEGSFNTNFPIGSYLDEGNQEEYNTRIKGE